MIELVSDVKPTKNVEVLKKDFDELVENRINSECNRFANTESALVLIIRGAIDYFGLLDSNFLGEGNKSGVPSSEADQFANNFYRLYNSIDYLAKLWNVEVEDTSELNLLKDIRTLLVHSGEQLTNIQSINLKGYKNIQLGKIFKSDSNTEIFIGKKYSYDYRIQLWADRHDQNKRRENNISHDIERKNYKDIDILIESSTIKNIILCYIEQFIDVAYNIKKTKKTQKILPERIKKNITNELNFDKLEELIKNKKRGGYIVENGVEIWDGFGLKQIKDYIKNNADIPQDVVSEIERVIRIRLDEFYKSYNNVEISNEDLPSLDIRDVFREYTPMFEQKGYLEGEKLFVHIAPSFNKKYSNDTTDIDYLLRFICEVNDVLQEDLNLENTANGIICDYFVKCVQMKIGSKEIIS